MSLNPWRVQPGLKSPVAIAVSAVGWVVSPYTNPASLPDAWAPLVAQALPDGRPRRPERRRRTYDLFITAGCDVVSNGRDDLRAARYLGRTSTRSLLLPAD